MEWKSVRASFRALRRTKRRCGTSAPGIPDGSVPYSGDHSDRYHPGYHFIASPSDFIFSAPVLLASIRAPAFCRWGSSASRAMKSRMISDVPSTIVLMR